jgi:hypothetical protein
LKECWPGKGIPATISRYRLAAIMTCEPIARQLRNGIINVGRTHPVP